ncbi:MAG: AAA domain-containing protein [Prevotella sp.]|nr:AAA domain-containing protein [Prevotella sp.]
MTPFERFEQPDVYVEDSNVVPIIIRYNDSNEEYHKKNNATSFRDSIPLFNGIHTCVFVNDGMSKGKIPRQQFLIILEDVGRSIRAQIDNGKRSFFGPSLLTESGIIPNDENEYIRCRCNICIEDNSIDVIDKACELHWGDGRLSELKSFVQSVAELKQPLKEIRKEEDQKIWASYAEGLEALTKSKQELRKISHIGKIHPEKNHRKEKIDVIDLEIVAMTNAEVLKYNIGDFDDHLRKPRFETDEDGKECSLIFDGYVDVSDDELKELESSAEQSCYKMSSMYPSHKLQGEFVFKTSDADKEEVISEFESLLSDYDTEYPQKSDNLYTFKSDEDATHAKDIIRERFENVLKATSSTNISISFMEEDQVDLLQTLKDQFVNINIIQQNQKQFYVLHAKEPIDCSKIEDYSLVFDSCRVKIIVPNFDPDIQVPAALSAKDGVYYGIIPDKTKIDKQPRGWAHAIPNAYKKKGKKTKCTIVEYVYAFRQAVNKKTMKSLARSLVGESCLRINTAVGRADCSPNNSSEYETIKEKISEVIPDNINVLFPEYKPSLTVSFLSEDTDYKQSCIDPIEKALHDLSCKWTIKDDAISFELSFDDEESRDKIVSRMRRVASEHSRIFDLRIEKPNGTTVITFHEDVNLREQYEKDLQGDFGRQNVNLIPSSYKLISEQLSEAKDEDDLDKIKELSKKQRELIYNAEMLGICINRTRNSVKIEVCKEFADKLDSKEISIGVGDYIQFPLIGEAINIARQKDAIDRILKPGSKNRYGKTISYATNPNLSNFLFDPRYAAETDSDIESVKAEVKERKIEDNMNERQCEAVAKAIEAKDMAFIQGPPGTGKTTVIAEIIWQEVFRNPNCKILLTSQTNTAVDNALERLQGKRGIRPIRIPKMDGEERMVRECKRYLFSQLQNWSNKPTEDNVDNAVNLWIDTILNEMDSSDRYAKVIARWKKDLTEKDDFVRKTFTESYERNVNLVAATCSICGSKNFNTIYSSLYDNNDMVFDVVIMDEASKATPLEMAIPMVLGKKIILIGDHKQLPPMIDGDEVKEALRKNGRGDLVDKLENIKESQFKRLFEASQKYRKSLVSTLDTQYRMHKQIMNCISHFYKDDIEGGLKCGIEETMDSADWSNRGSRYHGLENLPFINPDVHAIWVDVDGKEEKIGHSPMNRAELKAIEKILKVLTASKGYEEYLSHCTRPEDEEIGIITFYGAQVKELQKMNKEGKLGPGKFKIDVVDSFQGMERNIVIISTVRTDRIGFAKAIERINVAFSRAKRLLIVVGDKDFFARDVNYRTSIQAMQVVGINQLS